jgi:hypothetical protein
MGEAIRHIAPKAREAANVVARAVEVAGTTNTTVAKLGTSSAEVGEVVKVIDAIADQANLLAFTASMRHPRRRHRQGVRGHRQRGQGAGPGHREGDRRHRHPDSGDPG